MRCVTLYEMLISFFLFVTVRTLSRIDGFSRTDTTGLEGATAVWDELLDTFTDLFTISLAFCYIC